MKKPVRHTAPEFLLHLTLAEKILAKGGTLEAVAAHLKTVEGYASQLPATPAPVTLAVLKYQAGAGITRQEIVPIGATEKDYSALLAVISQGKGSSNALQDITVVNVVIKPEPLLFKDKDIGEVQTLLQERQKKILTHAVRPPASEEAAAQIMLLKLFIEQKEREAAYLSADNAKRLLAEASQNSDAGEPHNPLTQELETLEGRLRLEMPF